MSRRLALLLLAAVSLLALALRLFRLDAAGYWGDEIATLQYAALPLGEIWGADTMPPLYYALMKAWRVLGEDEWTMRLSSALLGSAAVPLVYATGRCFDLARGRMLGLLAALLVALSPFALEHAQTLRMYALLLFAAALALLGLARLLADPAAAARPLTSVGARWAWAGYGFGSLLALYSHNTGFLLPLSASLVALACWLGRPERAALAGNWLRLNLAVLLLWLPYWPRLLEQAEDVAANFWASNPDLAGFLAALREIQVGTQLQAPASWVAALFLLLALCGVAGLARCPRWLVFTLGLALLPALLSVAVGLFLPIFVPRTLVWTLIPGSLLVAAGVLWLLERRRALLPLSLALVLAAAGGRLYLVERYYAEPKNGDWRALAAFLLPRLQADGALVVLPWWDSFTPGFHLRRLSPAWDAWPSLRPGPPPLALEDARALLIDPAVGEVWLVHTTWHYAADLAAELLRGLEGCAAVGERQDFHGLVLLRLEAQPGC